MAARDFYQFQCALEPELVSLFATVSVGGAGAVTFQTFDPTSNTYSTAGSQGWRGIKSIVRTGTGTWTVTFQDPYQRCISMGASFLAAAGAPAAPIASLMTGATNAVRSNTTPTVGIQFQSAVGAAADPASGEQVTLVFQMANSSLKT